MYKKLPKSWSVSITGGWCKQFGLLVSWTHALKGREYGIRDAEGNIRLRTLNPYIHFDFSLPFCWIEFDFKKK